MKKSDFILIGLVLVIIAVAIFSTRGTKVEDEIEYPLTLTGEVGLNQITYNDYKKMVEDGDAFVVVIERTGCGYCQMYMPILEEYVKEKLLQKIKVKDIIVNYVGPVIGSHSGPGTVAIFYLGKER